ncbi:MAG: transglutaminase domain-containing protein [Deltaproteobacteria bacterium]|nr:transglutaminase domain-containing protein [Deltaproteobacteria bacterium]
MTSTNPAARSATSELLLGTPPATLASESVLVQIVKVLLYAAAFGSVQLYHPIATPVGFAAFVTATVLATVLAQTAFRAELKSIAGFLITAVFAVVFHVLAGWVRESTWAAGALGVDGTIYASDIFEFGLAALSILFGLRFFAKRYRVFAVVEIIAVVAVASYTLVEHRGLQINRPYWFADALFALGWDPVVFLKAFGVGLMVLGLVMALRRPGAGKGWLSFLVAIAVGVLAFIILMNREPPSAQAVPPTANFMPGDEGDEGGGEDKDGDGKPDKGDGKGDGKGGGGGGSGKNNSPFGKSNQRPPPQPVAVVTFHDDFEPKEPVLYFRQQVLSTFDQTHLNVDQSGRFDTDLLTRFPTTAPLTPATIPEPSLHKRVPTSMFLLTDHPQPVSLAHAIELKPLDNPNPNLFVAAYEVTSEVLDTEWRRLIGRRSVPDSWDEETRRHYTEYPNDPRYLALSDELVRDLDPRFQDDDLMKAIAIKRYLEKNGFYTMKETHKDETDPTASFLFGSMRGYCVHFAHSAVFLMRSQGIAARVAVGYGVDTARRGSGSSMLILGNMAHAWPEIYLDGVGWVTFDVYPEQSDEPPQEIVDQDLASMLGEIARNDPTGGMSATGKRTPFPWLEILIALAILAGSGIGSAYAVKYARLLMPSLVGADKAHRWALRAALDRLADLGIRRAPGETRERFAERVQHLTPHLRPLTMAHYRAALGPPGPDARSRTAAEAKAALTEVRKDLRRSIPWWKRLAGAVNPIGWWLTR